jgi:carboxylesterase type B
MNGQLHSGVGASPELGRACPLLPDCGRVRSGTSRCRSDHNKFFRLPTLAVAKARSGSQAASCFYELDWGHPPIGAGHSLEIPFVFHNLATPQGMLATTANLGWPAD